MTQNQIAKGLWVGDDKFNGEDWTHIIDLRGWDAEKTFAEKDYEYIDGILETLRLFMEDAGKILVHCHGGMDKSPFIVAMYLHVHHNLPPLEAYDAVQKRRTQTIIHGEWVFPYVEYLGTESPHMKMLKSCRRTK